MLSRATRTAITVYNFIPSAGTFQRTVIRDCDWTQSSQTNRGERGTAIPDGISIQIPYNYKYFSVQNGEVFDGKGWTVRLGPELEGSYIVKGECPFLSSPPQDKDFGAGGAVDASETGEEPGATEWRSWFILTLDTSPVDNDDFVRMVVVPFERKYKPVRPTKISELFYGSRKMWCLEVGC